MFRKVPIFSDADNNQEETRTIHLVFIVLASIKRRRHVVVDAACRLQFHLFRIFLFHDIQRSSIKLSLFCFAIYQMRPQR